ncbi:MAG: DNA-3-methyladenine glycosylase 2 family protein, partial [Lachnospiraceae bacterium]|nr:DNA-3-methyladenine glycosylase 2 family protein [Lachnospiraceae bacterium]
VTDGTVDLTQLSSLPDELVEAMLMRIKGVGPKVAGCVALFAYGRTSCAPIDVWIRRVMDLYYGGRNPFPRYGDTAGILQQYIYYAVQHETSDLLKD